MAENEDGRCEKESDPTNKVEPGACYPKDGKRTKIKQAEFTTLTAI